MCMYVFQTYIQFYAEFIIYSKLKHMYMYLLQTYIQFYAKLSSTQNSNISVCTYFKLTFRFQNEFIINLCACTQKGAFLYKRRMVHMCINAEWCIFVFTQNGSYVHVRRMVHFCIYAEWCIFV